MVHNPWSYVAFWYYMSEKGVDELSGTEQYCWENFKSLLTEWTPLGITKELLDIQMSLKRKEMTKGPYFADQESEIQEANNCGNELKDRMKEFIEKLQDLTDRAGQQIVISPKRVMVNKILKIGTNFDT